MKRRAIRKKSHKQERQIMNDLGGRVQPGSGAFPGHKGDGRVQGATRVEAKFTYRDSYQLKLSELFKIAGECTGMERPQFIIDFKDKFTGKDRGRFVVLRWSDFLHYYAKTIDDS